MFLLAFGRELAAFRRLVGEWARRDLQSRADLAANNLEEPLRTQNFRTVRATGEKLAADGYHLSVLSANGHGRIFDAQGPAAARAPMLHAEQRSGEYLVRLGIPEETVQRPFRRSLIVASLAGLSGVAGVLLFFLVTYRQRVRIRELQRLERFRRDFIADLSHEIKTPLTGIVGAADLLEGNSPLVPLIRREAARLNGLVQSILDLARLEREDRQPELVAAEVNEAMSESVARMRPVADSSGIELKLVTAPGGARARIDRQLLAQAVENLITNAIRHSGSPEVFVRVADRSGKIAVSVEDSGIGIPPEHVKRVFERFYRVDPSRAAETGGAGLGLAIVRRIAQAHGGEVELAPAKPHGSVFTLTLPACGGK